jgi:hypothetical protein
MLPYLSTRYRVVELRRAAIARSGRDDAVEVRLEGGDEHKVIDGWFAVTGSPHPPLKIGCEGIMSFDGKRFIPL